jgi:SWI/SNF-related matrix-associated actin-dependent regulator 1 of chromatin subfamily A
MSDFKLIVFCERIPRRAWYYTKFIYNEELKDKIKSLDQTNRKWNASKICWEVSVSGLIELIKSFKGSEYIHFDFGTIDSRKLFVDLFKKHEKAETDKVNLLKELNEKKLKWDKYKLELETTYIDYSQRLHALIKIPIKLYPHQIIAAMFMNETRSALISHEMGLGKTLSSILYVEMNNFKKVIVVTPNSLKFNYYNEVSTFTNSKAYIINWKKNTCTIAEAKYIIVNYDYFNPSDKAKMAKKWEKLKVGNINAVICDECQKLKNTDSNTYKNYKKLFNEDIFIDGKPSKIYLSGTPAPNRAFELYSVLNQISPLDFATKKYFYEYYCGMVYEIDGFGWKVDEDGEKRLEELYFKISPYTHRKRKAEVLTDLPDKTYQKIIFELSDADQKIYDDVEKNVANDLFSGLAQNALTTMLRLRQLTAKFKIESVVEIIENILETGEKVIIVDNFKESLYEFKKIFGNIAALHTGDQSVEERAELVKTFQDPNSEIKIFLASIQTANYGLTLTAASKMIIMTLPYSVGEYDQVADRCHRIGQKDAVNIYPTIVKDSIDEYVYDAIEGKRREITKVMDNEDYVSTTSEAVISDVINRIKNKYK